MNLLYLIPAKGLLHGLLKAIWALEVLFYVCLFAFLLATIVSPAQVCVCEYCVHLVYTSLLFKVGFRGSYTLQNFTDCSQVRRPFTWLPKTGDRLSEISGP